MCYKLSSRIYYYCEISHLRIFHSHNLRVKTMKAKQCCDYCSSHTVKVIKDGKVIRECQYCGKEKEQ